MSDVLTVVLRIDLGFFVLRRSGTGLQEVTLPGGTRLRVIETVDLPMGDSVYRIQSYSGDQRLVGCFFSKDDARVISALEQLAEVAE